MWFIRFFKSKRDSKDEIVLTSSAPKVIQTPHIIDLACFTELSLFSHLKAEMGENVWPPDAILKHDFWPSEPHRICERPFTGPEYVKKFDKELGVFNHLGWVEYLKTAYISHLGLIIDPKDLWYVVLAQLLPKLFAEKIELDEFSPKEFESFKDVEFVFDKISYKIPAPAFSTSTPEYEVSKKAIALGFIKGKMFQSSNEPKQHGCLSKIKILGTKTDWSNLENSTREMALLYPSEFSAKLEGYVREFSRNRLNPRWYKTLIFYADGMFQGSFLNLLVSDESCIGSRYSFDLLLKHSEHRLVYLHSGLYQSEERDGWCIPSYITFHTLFSTLSSSHSPYTNEQNDILSSLRDKISSGDFQEHDIPKLSLPFDMDKTGRVIPLSFDAVKTWRFGRDFTKEVVKSSNYLGFISIILRFGKKFFCCG